VVADLGVEELFDAGVARFGLTPRERDVMWRALNGERTREIATKLGIAASTVDSYIENAGIKIGDWDRSSLSRRGFIIAKLLGL
jgi:DNA-binding NarL/FixJ family response regulator